MRSSHGHALRCCITPAAKVANTAALQVADGPACSGADDAGLNQFHSRC